ncbi:MAG: hypothetical protein FJ100_08095 [Deltaproteobacteria bacterium]|nr:hypothetical protein [Deltaproteobacteria bacterium]
MAAQFAAADPPADAERQQARAWYRSKDVGLMRRACGVFGALADRHGDPRDRCTQAACLWALTDYGAAHAAFESCGAHLDAALPKAPATEVAKLQANRDMARVYAEAAARLLAAQRIEAERAVELAAAASETQRVLADKSRVDRLLQQLEAGAHAERAALQRQREVLAARLRKHQAAAAQLRARADAIAAENAHLRARIATLLQRVVALERQRLTDAAELARLRSENDSLRAALAAHAAALAKFGAPEPRPWAVPRD